MTQPPNLPGPQGQVPPQGWTPTPLGQPGYDPTQPLGAQRPPSVDIATFAPPRSRAPWLIGIAVVVAAVLIVIGANLPPGALFGTPSPSASPSPSESAAQAETGMPFTTSDGRVEGHWQILEQNWTDEGAQVLVRIAVDKGILRFSFIAFSNAEAEVIYPSPGADDPALGSVAVRPGEEVSGWVLLPAPRTDLTLILATESGRQISALPIAG